MKNPSKNFLLEIKLNFSAKTILRIDLIKKWKNLIKENKDVNFFLYKIEENIDEKIVIKAYLELSRYYRVIKVKNDFNFNNDSSVTVDVVKIRDYKDKSYLDSIFNGKKNSSIFWIGKPRFERNVLSPTNYEFVTKYNLLEKARSYYEMPIEWSEILNNILNEKKEISQVIQKLTSEEKEELIKLQTLEKEFPIDKKFRDEFLQNPGEETLCDKLNNLILEMSKKNQLESIFVFKGDGMNFRWEFLDDYFELRNKVIIKLLGDKKRRTLENIINRKTKLTKDSIMKK